MAASAGVVRLSLAISLGISFLTCWFAQYVIVGSNDASLSPVPEIEDGLGVSEEQPQSSTPRQPDIYQSTTALYDYIKANLTEGSTFDTHRTTTTASHPDPQRQKVLKAAPKSIVLMRAIGNALPPRHHINQTLINLDFTLRHEEQFPNVQRHWFLNRLVDPEVELQVIQLLERYNETYTVIPFDLQEYKKIRYRFDRFPSFRGLPAHGNQEVDHDKIVYTINVNGVRNTMLDYGTHNSSAEFILPWDGNCFLTRTAFRAISKGLNAAYSSQHNYFIVPMDRLRGKSNSVILRESYRPGRPEEPQIIFRRGAQARFNPHLRYGWRNKVELLSRLGRARKEDSRWAEGWERQSVEDWNTQYPVNDLHPKYPRAPKVGWVTRLSSRVVDAEARQDVRGHARSQGVIRLLARLDARLVRERSNLTGKVAANLPVFLFHKGRLRTVEHSYQSEIHSLAETCLSFPLSLGEPQTNKTLLPDTMLGNVTALALGYSLNDNGLYRDRAIALLKHWFIDVDSRVPVQYVEQIEPEVSVYQLRKLPWFLDSVKLFFEYMEKDDQKKIKNYLFRHLRLRMEQGKMFDATAFQDQPIGFLFDLELLSWTIHMGTLDKVPIIIHRAVNRWERYGSNPFKSCSKSPAKSRNCEVQMVQSWSTFSVLSQRLLAQETTLASSETTVTDSLTKICHALAS